jgi:hypothetical protein
MIKGGVRYLQEYGTGLAFDNKPCFSFFFMLLGHSVWCYGFHWNVERWAFVLLQAFGPGLDHWQREGTRDRIMIPLREYCFFTDLSLEFGSFG